MNIAQTYLDMCKEQGLSEREATRQICNAVGIKFAASYGKEWANNLHPRTIPPSVVAEMQQRCAVYAAQKVGIKSTDDKVKLFANMLSPKTKKK